MKNGRVDILLVLTAMLLASCSDDLDSSPTLDLLGTTEYFLDESSSAESPLSCNGKNLSSSSIHSSDDEMVVLSNSSHSSSSWKELSSNSETFSNSVIDISSSSASLDVSTLKPMITYSLTEAIVNHNNGCVEISGGIVTISCGGTYEFSGFNNDGQIIVNTLAEDSVVHIRLNNLTLKSAFDAPFFVVSSSRTIVKAVEGSVNTFEDAFTRSLVTYQKKGKNKLKIDTTKACVYSKDDLTINGTGTLNIVANYKNGIHTTNDLRIRDNPTIDVHAKNNALKGKGSVDIEGGTIVLKAVDGVGIKSDEGEDENSVVVGKGSVRVKGGKINIRSGDNGIDAYNEIIVSDEVSVPEIFINTLEKGMKASSLKIGNAVTAITSDGDGWKADDRLEVSAGYHYMNAAADGIDVQNAFSLTGGVVIVENVSEKESSSIVAFDSRINVKDGILLGFGKQSEGGFVHKVSFTPGKYYGLETGAFSPSFNGSLIVVERKDVDLGERSVDNWNPVCFPPDSTKCYYYK